MFTAKNEHDYNKQILFWYGLELIFDNNFKDLLYMESHVT